MYYFIPAWYGQGVEFWQPDMTPWYNRRKKIDFDDTLHQVRIFQEQDLDPTLLLLTYQPHLRYFLHRYDLLEANYFSVFDAIQGIPDQPMRCLQVKDLSWGDDCDFIYTPFAIVVEKRGQRYAEIELGPEGYLSMIRYFRNGQILREVIYDDRGFVSSILQFQDGRASYRAYMNSEGIWQLCHFLDGRGIVCNPDMKHRFKKDYYLNLEEVIWEFFDRYLEEQVQSSDCFVVASEQRMNRDVFEHLPQESKKVLTWFKERNQSDSIEDYEPYLKATQLVVSDHQKFVDQVCDYFPDQASKVRHMAPYDTRLSLGMSQRVKESKIFYQIDLDQLDMDAIYQVLAFVAKYPRTKVLFGCFNAQHADFETFKKGVEDLISRSFRLDDFVSIKESQGAENKLVENQEMEYRFDFVNLLDETTLMRELEYTRLIVDLSPEPHRYTQLAGISAGIPQINIVASDYVSHLENGYILEQLADFEEAAYYYLGQLKHWNQALIAAIDKIRENTGDRFVAKWENDLKEK